MFETTEYKIIKFRPYQDNTRLKQISVETVNEHLVTSERFLNNVAYLLSWQLGCWSHWQLTKVPLQTTFVYIELGEVTGYACNQVTKINAVQMIKLLFSLS